MTESEIYKLALKAKDQEIDEINSQIKVLESEKRTKLLEREQIRKKTLDPIDAFAEKYPGLSDHTKDRNIIRTRAKFWMTKSEAEILAELKRIQDESDRYWRDQDRLNSPG